MHSQPFILLILVGYCLPLAFYGQDSMTSKKLVAYPGIGMHDIFLQGFKDSLIHMPKMDSVKLGPGPLMRSKLLPADNFEKLSIDRKKPLLSVSSGMISYHFLYRSQIDTPFVDKNLAQHQSFATFGMRLFDLIPFRVNTYLRRSNSRLFRDITDVQVQFDANSYRSQAQQVFKQELYNYSCLLKDTITEKFYLVAQDQLAKLSDWIKSPEIKQKLVEANEIVHVPEITYDKSLPDSINLRTSDSLQKIANGFIEYYRNVQQKQEQLSAQIDSLKEIYEKSVQKLRRFQQLIQQPLTDGTSYQKLIREAEKFGFNKLNNSYGNAWLMGLQKLGIGKNNVYASELVAKNITVSGLDVEYNSWYYLRLVAGAIDYRYRDFMTYKFDRPRQNLYLLRIGLGRVDGTSFVVSAFHGQKQFVAGTPSSIQTINIPVSGLSVEARWQLQNNSYLVSEIAQSFSPNLNSSSGDSKGNWRLSETDHKAFSVKFYSYIPGTSSRLEAKYKFIGANFQSFNSFQTNAQVKSWSITGEQNFLNRRIKVTGNLNTNEFSNPFIRQNYKSNTVFKTFNAKVNIKKWPVVSIGYLPMSQLTMVGGYLSESKFQTVNASIGHIYKIGQARGSSSLVFTKFFNGSADTGFIFFNSANLFGSQSFFFKNFTINLNLSTSKNYGYTYTVIDENMSFPVNQNVNIGVGVKLNKLNEEAIRLGGFFNGNLRVFRKDIFSFQFERSYLPERNLLLVPGFFGSLSYTKTLK